MEGIYLLHGNIRSRQSTFTESALRKMNVWIYLGIV